MHGFSGCGFTNAIYSKRKKQLLKIFKANASELEYIRDFNFTDSTANEIEKAGERFFLFLHEATNYSISRLIISDIYCFENPLK